MPITEPTRVAQIDDAAMKVLVQDLHRPSRAVYWTDLLLTATLGWSAFTVAVVAPLWSWPMVCSAVAAACAAYRGLCFLHEITHQSRRALPGFETVWNWLLGYPLLMPSFVYVGVHQDHHRLSSYGTERDPEYLPFAHNFTMTVLFALQSFLLPLALAFRFWILAPLSLAFPPLRIPLARCASALTMNVNYRREPTPALLRSVTEGTLGLVAFWSAVFSLALLHILPWRLFIVWLAIDSLVSFVNTLRTLGAHAYENKGEPLDRAGQLLDSIDTPGAWWTELWAPVGLRYHALHHYFPGIPYHNLSKAYRRVLAHLPVSQPYRQMTSRSLPHSLRQLLRKGRGIWTDSRLKRRDALRDS